MDLTVVQQIIICSSSGVVGFVVAFLFIFFAIRYRKRKTPSQHSMSAAVVRYRPKRSTRRTTSQSTSHSDRFSVYIETDRTFHIPRPIVEDNTFELVSIDNTPPRDYDSD